jgi:hypothetical protein
MLSSLYWGPGIRVLRLMLAFPHPNLRILRILNPKAQPYCRLCRAWGYCRRLLELEVEPLDADDWDGEGRSSWLWPCH